MICAAAAPPPISIPYSQSAVERTSPSLLLFIKLGLEILIPHIRRRHDTLAQHHLLVLLLERIALKHTNHVSFTNRNHPHLIQEFSRKNRQRRISPQQRQLTLYLVPPIFSTASATIPHFPFSNASSTLRFASNNRGRSSSCTTVKLLFSRTYRFGSVEDPVFSPVNASHAVRISGQLLPLSRMSSSWRSAGPHSSYERGIAFPGVLGLVGFFFFGWRGLVVGKEGEKKMG